MEELGNVLKTVNGWELLGLIVALGAVTMAVLQMITDLTPLRWVFNTLWLQLWIYKRLREYREYREYRGPDANSEEAFNQLISYSTGGHSRPLFGLPPSQLVAQINAAAQSALENPNINFSLLAALSQPTKPRIPLILRYSRSSSEHLDDLMRVYDYVPGSMKSEDAPESKDADSAEEDVDEDPELTSKDAPDSKGADGAKEDPELTKYLNARVRLANLIQRNLDGIQIALGNDSALANQISAILISIGLAYLIVRAEQPSSPVSFQMTLLLGVAAGYVAPVLGDVVAAIRKLGRT